MSLFSLDIFLIELSTSIIIIIDCHYQEVRCISKIQYLQSQKNFQDLFSFKYLIAVIALIDFLFKFPWTRRDLASLIILKPNL